MGSFAFIDGFNRYRQKKDPNGGHPTSTVPGLEILNLSIHTRQTVSIIYLFSASLRIFSTES